MDTPAVSAFRAASLFFAEAVAAVPADRYGQPWSDEWRVLDLIGHGNRANLLPVEYYERPVQAVRSASERAWAVIESAPDGAVVGTPFGERTLDAYLPSRTAELVLHGLDLDTSIVPAAEALVGCGAFLVTTAVGNGRGVDVVRALSGRGALPPQFSVY